jgi:hypothetical protein
MYSYVDRLKMVGHIVVKKILFYCNEYRHIFNVNYNYHSQIGCETSALNILF